MSVDSFGALPAPPSPTACKRQASRDLQRGLDESSRRSEDDVDMVPETGIVYRSLGDIDDDEALFGPLDDDAGADGPSAVGETVSRAEWAAQGGAEGLEDGINLREAHTPSRAAYVASIVDELEKLLAHGDECGAAIQSALQDATNRLRTALGVASRSYSAEVA